jgi:cysteine-rich repeat protein
MIIPPETCDDNNTIAADGCSLTCTIEQGYTCLVPGTACQTICGDAFVIGS